MSNKILKGTIWLTGAAFLSKFLGMIYAIPFNELVGPKGVLLYYFAYNPYTILLGISTIGIPSAVSKMVSKYNTLGHPDVGVRIFRTGLFFMLLTGFLSFITLYFTADWLASRFVYSENTNQTIEVSEVSQVIRTISIALVVIPAMSVARGFFQGNQTMKPTAVSQIIEQVVRILFVLFSALLIIKFLNGQIITAVKFATLGAFVGAIASCFILFLFWRSFKDLRTNYLKRNGYSKLQISNREILIEMLQYAGPFILVSVALPLYQAVDSFTFNKAMVVGGYGDVAELSLAALNFNGHKLILIPVTLAAGMSMTIIPALTKSFTKKKVNKLHQEINQTLQIVLMLVVPAVVGLSTLSYEAYGSLFGMKDLEVTGNLLAWYAPVALLLAFFSITFAILQGINEQRFTLISLTVGFLVKLLLNSFLIHMFGAKGSIFATALAVGIAGGLNLWWMKRSIYFSFLQTFKRTLLISLFTVIMFGGITLIKFILGHFLPYEESRMAATIMLMVGVVTGGLIYLLLAYKSTLLEHVLGDINFMKRFKRKRTT